jgi:hypothetical protein
VQDFRRTSVLSRTVGKSPGAGGGGGGGAGNDGAELLLSVTPFPVKTNTLCSARNYKRKQFMHSPVSRDVLFAISL